MHFSKHPKGAIQWFKKILNRYIIKKKNKLSTIWTDLNFFVDYTTSQKLFTKK